jgi:hypothetical protein
MCKIINKDPLVDAPADTLSLKLKIMWELSFFQKINKIKINLYS